MKKVILESKEKGVDVRDINFGDHIGFIDSGGNKGHFVNVGMDKNGKRVHHAICVENWRGLENSTYGEINDNQHTTPKTEIICSVSIKEMYVFDTIKELYKWLSED